MSVMSDVRWEEGALLCCHVCDQEVPHYSKEPNHLKCSACGALVHILTVIASYALEDDYANPARVQLPLRLRPRRAPRSGRFNSSKPNLSERPRPVRNENGELIVYTAGLTAPDEELRIAAGGGA